jgi:hypothetical protein
VKPRTHIGPVTGWIALLTLALPLLSVARLDFERYRSILDRKPFGVESPPAPEGAPPPPPVEPFVKFIKLSAIVRDKESGELQVGLVDLKGGHSYMLGVGEEQDGIKICDADYAAERALLEKENKSYWLGMDGTFTNGESAIWPAAAAVETPAPVKGAPVAAPTPMTAAPVAAPTPIKGASGIAVPGVMRRTTGADLQWSATAGTGTNTAGTRSLSYLERRRLRDEWLRRANAPAEQPAAPASTNASTSTPVRLEGESFKKQLQAYQMQLIREGRTPLPIPLTKEMDDQLVAEGVLPPLEEVREETPVEGQ